jgi:hypothetical protein
MLPKTCVCVCVCVLRARQSLQEFYAWWQGLSGGPKRLVAYTVFGDTYYAGPGEVRVLGQPYLTMHVPCFLL